MSWGYGKRKSEDNTVIDKRVSSTTGRIVTCQNCGKLSIISLYDFNRGKYRFCSHYCYYDYRKKYKDEFGVIKLLMEKLCRTK